MQTLEIQDRPFSVGLDWKGQYDAKGRTGPLRLARQVAHEEGVDTAYEGYAWFRDAMGIGQLALVREPEGEEEDLFDTTPLALVGAVVNEGTWAGRFALPGGTVLVVAVQNGVVQPGTGEFPADEAEEQFETITMLLEGWDPDGTVVTETVDESMALFAEWVDKCHEDVFDCTVQSIAIVIPWRKVAVVSVVVVVLVAGGLLWHHHKVEQARAARKARIARERAILAKKRAKESKTKPPEWAADPSPSRFVSRCSALIGHQPYSVNGWKAVDVRCMDEGIEVKWQRTDGGRFDVLPKGALIQMKSPNTAFSGRKVPDTLKGRSKWHHALSQQRGAQRLFQAAHASHAGIKVSWSSTAHFSLGHKLLEAVGAGSGKNGKAKPAHFRMTVKTSPGALGAALDSVPGVVVDAVEWNVGKESWQITGEIYVHQK